MLLGTYRLQDPNGTELEALIHGNRLIKAAISTAEELRDLWASPAVKVTSAELTRSQVTVQVLLLKPINHSV